MAGSPLAGRPSHGYATPVFHVARALSVACLPSRRDRRFAPMPRASMARVNHRPLARDARESVTPCSMAHECRASCTGVALRVSRPCAPLLVPGRHVMRRLASRLRAKVLRRASCAGVAFVARECRVAIIASRRCLARLLWRARTFASLVRDVRASVTPCSMSRGDAPGCASRSRARRRHAHEGRDRASVAIVRVSRSLARDVRASL